MSAQFGSAVVDAAPGSSAPKGVNWQALAAEGLTASQAAKRAGATISAAVQAATRQGFVWAPSDRAGVTGPKGIDWPALAKLDLTCRQAAALAGVTLTAAHVAADRGGWAWRPARPRRASWAVLHAQGLTAAEAARRAGRPVTHAQNWAWRMRRAGVYVTWARAGAGDAQPGWAQLYALGLGLGSAVSARAGAGQWQSALAWARSHGVDWSAPRDRSAPAVDGLTPAESVDLHILMWLGDDTFEVARAKVLAARAPVRIAALRVPS
jgi:hypothetical protein